MSNTLQEQMAARGKVQSTTITSGKGTAGQKADCTKLTLGTGKFMLEGLLPLDEKGDAVIKVGADGKKTDCLCRINKNMDVNGAKCFVQVFIGLHK